MRLWSPTLTDPITFDGDPIWYKLDGICGYLIPVEDKVFFFYPVPEIGGLSYEELNDWIILRIEV